MMDSESGGFSRCARHPSHVFTGVCSLCLAERLASVDSAERSRNPSCRPQGEVVEISLAAPELERKPGDGRPRKTLLSLFELDDRNDAETRASGSCSAAGDASNDASVALDPQETENLKDPGASFRLGSMFARRPLRWRKRSSSSDKSRMPEQSSGDGFEDGQSENKRDFRHSCDWSLCRDPGRAQWEVPRHSWDGGSMVSKAFACSFACLEEPQDGSCRIKRSLPEGVTTVDPVSYIDKIDACKIHIAASAHDTRQEVSVSGISRKKSHRWSRVWDWSITSPLRDLVKKCEHVLERSPLESWHEGHKDKSMETVESDVQVQFYGNGHGCTRTNRSSNRSMNAVSGNLHNFRLDWQQKKKDCKLGRSRSVHYSSPGNLDNGLLRFYLTPMRSSRRSTTNGRMKTSSSFARGVLGLH